MNDDSDAASEDEYEYEVGDKVTFEDEGTTHSGEITAISGDKFTVQEEDGQEWTLGIDELSPAE